MRRHYRIGPKPPSIAGRSMLVACALNHHPRLCTEKVVLRESDVINLGLRL